MSSNNAHTEGVAARLSQSKPYSIWMAESVIARGQGLAAPDGDSGQWLRVGFFQTAVLELLSANGIDDICEQREMFLDYLECSTRTAASLVLDARTNVTFSLDRLSLGRGLFSQYGRTNDELYQNALDALRESIDLQPRNHLGGLWYFHYPNLSYLDGLYMLVPFMLDYSGRRGNSEADKAVREILQQISLLWRHCFHEPSGLFVHGYDSLKKYEWANNETGASPFVWGRSLAWLTLALLAALESPTISKDSAEWDDLKAKFQYLVKRVVHCGDSESKGWWQLMCSPDLPGNYIESSCSSIFVYVILRGLRLGFIDSFLLGENIERATCEAYDAITQKFVVRRDDGTLGFNGTVDVCSLNSSASYDYYLSRPIQQDSVLGASAFVLASLERESHIGRASD